MKTRYAAFIEGSPPLRPSAPAPRSSPTATRRPERFSPRWRSWMRRRSMQRPRPPSGPSASGPVPPVRRAGGSCCAPGRCFAIASRTSPGSRRSIPVGQSGGPGRSTSSPARNASSILVGSPVPSPARRSISAKQRSATPVASRSGLSRRSVPGTIRCRSPAGRPRRRWHAATG